MDANQFRQFVIRPTLERLGAPFISDAAVELLLGTALAESGGLRWLKQLGGGPALGVYQIEPATHDDVWDRYLLHRPDLAARVRAFAAPGAREPQLITNLAYATVIARLIYWRAPGALPEAHDVAGLGRYWKAHYNTALGAGTAGHFEAAYRRHT